MSDYIKRKSIRDMYSCLDPNARVLVGQVQTDIDAIPPAEVYPKGSEEAELAYAEGFANGEEAERSRHVDRPRGEWIKTENYTIKCCECGAEFTDDIMDACLTSRVPFPRACPICMTRMRGADDE